MAMVKGGTMQPTRNDVEDIVELLRAGELKKRLPCQHIAMDDQFLRNFKNRCRLHSLDPERK
jgi:hypothetical protein